MATHEADLKPQLELRRATNSAHERVEAALNLGNPNITVGEYRQALNALWVLWFIAETRLADYLSEDIELNERLVFTQNRRLNYLSQDLTDLGALPDAGKDAEFAVGSRQEALGVAYVLEGSRLGSVQLSNDMSADPRRLDWPRRFFDAGSSTASTTWQAFRSALTAEINSRQHLDTAIDAATRTFELLEKGIASEHAPIGGPGRPQHL